MAFDRSSLLRRAASVALVLAFGAAPALAGAAELSAADRQTARALMDEGHAHRARSEMREALESFRAADALMHVPSTGIEVARSLGQVGRLLEAYEAALAVRRLPARADEPAPFVEARRDADRLLDELDVRIPTLRVEVLGAGDAPVALTLDGAPVGMNGAHSAVRKLDPGTYLVVATSGARQVSVDVTVREREQRDVTLDLATEPGPPPPTRAPEAPPLLSAPPLDAAPASSSHVLLHTGLAVGGAGLVAGAITGILALSHRNTAEGQCIDDRCPPSVHDDVDAARTLGSVSTVAFVVAGIGAGLVVVDLVRPRARGSASVTFAPGSVVLHGSF